MTRRDGQKDRTASSSAVVLNVVKGNIPTVRCSSMPNAKRARCNPALTCVSVACCEAAHKCVNPVSAASGHRCASCRFNPMAVKIHIQPATDAIPLIAVGLFSYQIGGSERVGVDVALECVRRGYRVLCFAFYDSNGPMRAELEASGVECLDMNYLEPHAFCAAV